ncbi:MAG: LamG domain-containing protein [Dysgonamonadaceae bacterium]|jgi:hypothetical protein|nr:LamG domain-containing protein [Dysgonamonadaceae bacterium]
MKNIKFIPLFATVFVMFSFLLTSCFQDLEQDLALGDYPDGYDGAENLGDQGETFYMSFETADFMELVSENDAILEGSPTVVSGKIGNALQCSTTAFLKYSRTSLTTNLGNEFSATFWYKMGSASRAGILTCGKDNTAHDERKFGFRFFREGSATAQRFKLNMGNGTAEVYADGGTAADRDPAIGWIHIAFVIAEGRCAVYIDGTLVKESTFTGAISWDGCTEISIGSGAPTFTVWSHLSDDSQIDELRMFNKALTEAQINELYSLR